MTNVPACDPRLAAPAISPMSFMVPEWMPLSAWTGHGPFAAWLVEALRPRSFVELGSHSGYSFFAVCQAARLLGLSTRCTAIDTWQGDEHAGFYGESIFQLVSRQAQHYGDSAKLLRMTFEQAAPHIADGSVDLLHVDGRHFYDDAKFDFELYRPKLSSRAVVLFHDTQVRDAGFGVYKLWAELAPKFPSFEFHHSHGLGVLALGRDIPVTMRAFFEAGHSEAGAVAIRSAYARLGRSLAEPAKARKGALANGPVLMQNLARDLAKRLVNGALKRQA